MVKGEGRAHGREGGTCLTVNLLPTAANGQNGTLRRVDDGSKLLDSEHAQVGDGESAALKKKFVIELARALGKISQGVDWERAVR